MAKKIAFCNNKGGVLKTSLSTNYACVLANANKKTLIIDTDSQCGVIASFRTVMQEYAKNKKTFKTLYDLTFNDAKIKSAIIPVNKNLDVISCGELWRNSEQQIQQSINTGEAWVHIKNIIKEVDKKYDYIIVDTEPKKGINVFNVLLSVDEVIIPFTLDAFGIQALQSMLDYVEQAKQANKQLKIKALVPTKTLPRSKTETLIQEQQNKLPHSNLITKATIPHSAIGINAITLKGIPVVYTNKCKLTQAYFDLVKELEKI